MSFIDLLNNHASAIFGGVGIVFGFLSNYFLKKLNRKYEISNEEAKEYFKQKRIILNEALQLISEYEITQETLHDFYYDYNGIPIKIVTKEDIYRKYFLKIFTYLHANRIYLEEDTIKKLDTLKKEYYNFIVSEKILYSEDAPSNEDSIRDFERQLESLKKELYENTFKKFNSLNEEIKYTEINLFKEKVS